MTAGAEVPWPPLSRTYASQWLGDFGAEVIKVEPPKGDSTRHTGPSTEAGWLAR